MICIKFTKNVPSSKVNNIIFSWMLRTTAKQRRSGRFLFE